MRKRAFTLLEVTIVLSLITIVSTGFVGLIRNLLRHNTQTVEQTMREQDCRRAALRIFNLSRAGARILPDQRGLQLLGRDRIVFEQGSLRYRGRPMLNENLRDFAVVRREGQLHLLFEYERGRFEFDQPGRGSL